MYVVTLSVFHNLAIWLLYVNKPEPESNAEYCQAVRTTELEVGSYVLAV